MVANKFHLNFLYLPIFNLGVNGIDTPHLENFNEFGPTLPKRRFLQPPEMDVIENGVSAIDATRNRTIFKGYYAGSPPALLGRVDARYCFISGVFCFVFTKTCFRTIMLEEEISLLHKEIAQLKRQVCFLRGL